MKNSLRLSLAFFALACAQPGFAGDTKSEEMKATFNGYRRFHGTCHACHGQDAMGGSFAPALTESLKTIDYESFVTVVMEGRQATDATGAVSAMPAFAEDPNITKHLDDIYRYVSARADGALGPGRPPKLPKKKCKDETHH